MPADSNLESTEDSSNNSSAFGVISLGLGSGYYSWSHDDVFRLLIWVSDNMPESFKHLNKANISAITEGAFPNHPRIKNSNVKNKLSNLKRRYLVLKHKLQKVEQTGDEMEIETERSEYYIPLVLVETC